MRVVLSNEQPLVQLRYVSKVTDRPRQSCTSFIATQLLSQLNHISHKQILAKLRLVMLSCNLALEPDMLPPKPAQPRKANRGTAAEPTNRGAAVEHAETTLLRHPSPAAELCSSCRCGGMSVMLYCCDSRMCKRAFDCCNWVFWAVWPMSHVYPEAQY